METRPEQTCWQAQQMDNLLGNNNPLFENLLGKAKQKPKQEEFNHLHTIQHLIQQSWLREPEQRKNAKNDSNLVDNKWKQIQAFILIYMKRLNNKTKDVWFNNVSVIWPCLFISNNTYSKYDNGEKINR